MSRKQSSKKRVVSPDPVYGNTMVQKFINHIMYDGKKTVAQGCMYAAFEVIQAKRASNPVEVFERALRNVRPLVEVKSRRIGGATYQVPTEVRDDRGTALAMRWLIDSARARGEKGFYERLAAELMDAAGEEEGSEGRGGAIRKREDVHRMAEANKAFSHFKF